jgi:glyoxylase-like metal-dependent hydrolase (beta-lactamase superfamily II)
MTDHREIDLHFQGSPHAICCHRIDGWLVDPGPESCLPSLLAGLGDERPRGVLLTHIHFDHAGVSGALVERWPDLPVYVHARGAAHLVDPGRLVASAQRIWGDAMERLWGRIVAVPEANLHVLDGDAAAPDGFAWAYTPGHAQHHVAYRHEESGIVFAGDVAGVRIGDGPVLAPTPPPDIDPPLWQASVDRLAEWQPTALALAHFGTYTDVADHLARVHADLDRLMVLSREADAEEFARVISAEMAATSEEQAYHLAMDPDTLFAGLSRYWQKRDTPSTS